MNYTPLDLTPHRGYFSKFLVGGLIVASFLMVGMSVYLNLPSTSSSRANFSDPSLIGSGGNTSAPGGAGTSVGGGEPQLVCPSNYEKINEGQTCNTDLQIISSTSTNIRCCAIASSAPPTCENGSKPLTQDALRSLPNISIQCPNPVPAINSDGSQSTNLFCCPQEAPGKCVEPDYQFSDSIKCMDCPQ